MDGRKARKPESESRKRIRAMTAEGLTPRQIGMALGISPQAVYKHLQAIRRDDAA